MTFPVPEDLALHVAKGDRRQAPVVPRVQGLPRVLCVDDDERLLAGLELRLRRRFDVSTATSAAEALAKLGRSTPFAAVISDMRMPNADGARFLSAIRRVAPETTRILLTGQADVASAIAAVNDGEIFRFLLKPIDAPALIAVLDEAVARHRELVAQQTLTEEVLRGTVDLLAASMASLSPNLAMQSNRARALVADVSLEAAPRQGWVAELAAVAIHLALAEVAPDLALRWRARLPLNADEVRSIDTAMRHTVALLRRIPKAGPICDAIVAVAPRADGKAWGTPSATVEIPVRILYLALYFDAALQRGVAADEVLDELRQGASSDDLTLIALLAAAPSQLEPGSTRVPLGRVQPGRRITHDVRLPNGVLFLPKGHDVTLATLDMLDALDEESRHVRVVTIASPRGAIG